MGRLARSGVLVVARALVIGGALVTAAMAAGCGDREKQPHAGDRAAGVTARRDDDMPLAVLAKVITRPEVSGVPAGYQLMKPVATEPNAVLLLDQAEATMVPIYIGTTEAHSIELRLRGQPPPRPLTHDLFDAALRELGVELVRVQIDDLREGVFIASVFLRQGARIIELDARASDAIALALGNDIPVYVAEHVVRYTGVAIDSQLTR